MKILVSLAELYYKVNDKYVSPSVSFNFFKSITDYDVKFIASVGNKYKNLPSAYNSLIDREQFIELPFFDSIQSFAFNYYFNRKFRNKTLSIFRENIKESDILWARNPSLSSIIFSEIVLKSNKILISHICADIEFSWKNPKYKGYKKLLALLMSKFILYKIKKISRHKNTYTLCTGSKLLKQFKPLNKNTHFFIDSLISKHDFKNKTSLDNSFLFVGRLNIEKGIMDLLEACKILKNKNINFSLDIVGFGDLEAEIVAFVDNFQLENHINFIGSLPHSDVVQYYEKNSFFILPSNADYEGFPRVILEAWSYSMPVITTNVGGIDGLGKHRNNLLFVERSNPVSIANGMQEMILDVNLVRKMQDNILENRDFISSEYQHQVISDLLNEINS